MDLRTQTGTRALRVAGSRISLAVTLIVTTSLLLLLALGAAAFFNQRTITALAENEAAVRRRSGEEAMTRTTELQSNHLGTVREGAIACSATAQHLGRTTQVWDATVTDEASGRVIALFRCTQMVLWPRG